METTTAGWQLDFFGEAAAIVVTPPKIDPLPDPSLWSASVREQMVDALISLACDSRRGDNMPESLIDCADLLRDRIRSKPSLDLEDYSMTLGWIFGYWDGALPYTYVCAVCGVSPEVLQDVILNNARLKADLDEVRRQCCGSLL
ncbi:hypothetical protein [Cupriavidus agavae]|uniref:Uncharacterized protein n=1 Tax=Cupriavidus agavae TaxID=1001822 RepID=A0A4Q7RNW4_9BURK|nr:hypothetical protein [Cupriavidus agavae]RZT35396.1 hypothetical protein EV147_3832 [Cupriavidus agavae]